MKSSIITIFTVLIFAFSFNSCDKVAYPNVIDTTLDTTIFPGNFRDYEFPTFEENTNTLRNALIADYTGHRCTFCPNAAIVAHNIEIANPGRAFVASIHAGASVTGVTSFQELDPPKYTTDFTNEQGLEMAGRFFQEEVGFNANPMGNVNRVKKDIDINKFFYPAGSWAALADSILNTTLDINISAKSNYFPESHGAYIHTNVEFVNTLEGTYNIVVYAIENKRIAAQYWEGEDVYDYEHHNIHLGNLYDETWGRLISSGTTNEGTSIKTDFSYNLPEELSIEEMHFLVMVINRETYEVMQVIKHEL